MIHKKRQSFLGKINELFLKTDFLSNPQYLKYKGEGTYQTYTGSTLSVALVITFLVCFYNMVISTINRQQITLNIKNKPSLNSKFLINTSDSQFMFAIGISSLNMSSSQRYFNISLDSFIYRNGIQISQQNIPLNSCTPEQWNINQQFQSLYTRLNLNAWVCPPSNYTFGFTGKYTSEEFQFSKLVIKPCSGKGCVNSSTFNQKLINLKNFKLNIYFVNPIISPSQTQYINYVLQDSTNFQFTDAVGVRSQIFFTEYQMNTDKSIMPNPLKDLKTQKGLTLLDRPTVNNFQVVGNTQYARIIIRKSDIIQVYDRSYARMDATLSYLGGLFGMILILFYGINVFSQYAFQFEIGSELFVSNDRKQFQSKKFNILTFPVYLLYCLISFFYQKCENWKCFEFYRNVDECREQIKQQTDICFLLKRVIYIEKAIQIFFKEKLNELSLDHRWTIQQAERKRKFYDDHKRNQQMIIKSERKATNRKRIQIINDVSLNIQEPVSSNSNSNQSPPQKTKGEQYIYQIPNLDENQVVIKITQPPSPEQNSLQIRNERQQNIPQGILIQLNENISNAQLMNKKR